MADSAESHGFRITTARISLLLSVLALLAMFYEGSRFILDSQFRIAALEKNVVEMRGDQKSLSADIRALSTTINDLNVTLREVQVRQEPRP